MAPIKTSRELSTSESGFPTGTGAYIVYSHSVAGLDALLAMVFPLLPESPKSERYLVARRLKVENEYSGRWAVDVRQTMLSWQVAMRVSAVEVYLQDALTVLAVRDHEFMRTRRSKQQWDYDTARAASEHEDALWTFCNRWARSFVGDGGPARWAEALTASGLGKYDPNDIVSLEAMWGVRHMTIHDGGRLTREFASRHGQVAHRLSFAGVQLDLVQDWLATADRFVREAEAGILGRLDAAAKKGPLSKHQQVTLNRQVAWLVGQARLKREVLSDELWAETMARVRAEGKPIGLSDEEWGEILADAVRKRKEFDEGVALIHELFKKPD
jgi:hypothetical protein